MTREEAIKCIEKEDLSGYNFFEDRYNKENEVVIKEENEGWIVYATDERASKVTCSEKKFDTENEALENLIKRLRADKILREL